MLGSISVVFVYPLKKKKKKKKMMDMVMLVAKMKQKQLGHMSGFQILIFIAYICNLKAYYRRWWRGQICCGRPWLQDGTDKHRDDKRTNAGIRSLNFPTCLNSLHNLSGTTVPLGLRWQSAYGFLSPFWSKLTFLPLLQSARVHSRSRYFTDFSWVY